MGGESYYTPSQAAYHAANVVRRARGHGSNDPDATVYAYVEAVQGGQMRLDAARTTTNLLERRGWALNAAAHVSGFAEHPIDSTGLPASRLGVGPASELQAQALALLSPVDRATFLRERDLHLTRGGAAPAAPAQRSTPGAIDRVSAGGVPPVAGAGPSRPDTGRVP